VKSVTPPRDLQYLLVEADDEFAGFASPQPRPPSR